MTWAGLLIAWCVGTADGADSSPLLDKAKLLQRVLIERHLVDGLYVSIVPATKAGVRLRHDVDEPGNVIHAGVWTGRYLAGLGYQYATTKDPAVRKHAGDLLVGLRRLQEITGKPGLLARGYVRGHGPVEGYERDGRDSAEWRQGQGKLADYRWYGDVSVDNFNAVLYGYAVYYDLAADDEQKKYIAFDADRLMTHLLDNHCRIIDVDGEVTQWGHVGFDPDPAMEQHYRTSHPFYRRYGEANVGKLPLRAQLMLLPDLLIAEKLTGRRRYRDFYDRLIAQFKENPEVSRRREPTPESLARFDHSSTGQSYEALYNLIRYETNPALLEKYRPWVADAWRMTWMTGNPLFTYTVFATLPEGGPTEARRAGRAIAQAIPHGADALRQADETLRRYPIDRGMRPVMNSLRQDIQKNPAARRQALALRPLPIDERPRDNEYEWKGNPYQLDGWLKPTVIAMAFACDDPKVAWACDSAGKILATLNWPNDWRDASAGLMGAVVRNIHASPQRTFVLHALTDRGVVVTRDGGRSWRTASEKEAPSFAKTGPDFSRWTAIGKRLSLRIDDKGQLIRSVDAGNTSSPAMVGWRIPRCASFFSTPRGVVASGPGGAYWSSNAETWRELPIWPDFETGPADYLHAYWMGRYYGFVE